jgi:hypothetical protein
LRPSRWRYRRRACPRVPLPLFAALYRYRKADADHTAVCRLEPGYDSDQYEQWHDAESAALERWNDAEDALFETVPTTAAGAAALVAAAMDRNFDAEFMENVLGTLADFLKAQAGA